MEITSKEEAKEKGFSLYFTGKTCRNGGVAPRRVSNNQCTCEFCKEIKAKRDAEYHQRPEVKEKDNERSRKFYRNNKELHAQRVKSWKERNAESYAEYQRKHRKENKEYYYQLYRQYYQENKHEYARRCKERRARERQATPSWYEKEKDRVKGLYDLCQELKELTGEDFEVDHMYPVMGKTVCGLHCYDNMQPIPSYMNEAKQNKLEYTEYLSWIEDYDLCLYTPVCRGADTEAIDAEVFAPRQTA